MAAPASSPPSPGAIVTPLSGVRPRPLLASDALREELAPLTPRPRLARRLCALASAGLGTASALQFFVVGTPPATRSALEGVSGAAVALALALLPLPYAARAHATTALGAILLGMALLGRGPAAALLDAPGTALPWEMARVLAATLLPAALLFRTHYRAFPRARMLLGWGLALALPFVIRSGYLLLLAPRWSDRITAGAAVGSVLLALLGFMGSNTTAAGSLWAACLLGSLTLDIAARALLPSQGPHAVEHLATAVAFLMSAGLVAFGLFQTLAHALAPAARSAVDDHCRRCGLGEGP